MDELEPDAALSAEVESVFDRLRYAELEIIVRLPGECTSDGHPVKFTHRTILPAEFVRMEDPHHILPLELERLMRLLVMSLRFR